MPVDGSILMVTPRLIKDCSANKDEIPINESFKKLLEELLASANILITKNRVMETINRTIIIPYSSAITDMT